MLISFCCTDTKPEPWLTGLQEALPDSRVEVWKPGAAPADYAVVWAPPQQFVNEQPQLKALFNIGAGVDALLKLQLAPGTQLVRLEDAGMAIQMAEYVCHYVIRHFREFEAYEANMHSGTWSFRNEPCARNCRTAARLERISECKLSSRVAPMPSSVTSCSGPSPTFRPLPPAT